MEWEGDWERVYVLISIFRGTNRKYRSKKKGVIGSRVKSAETMGSDLESIVTEIFGCFQSPYLRSCLCPRFIHFPSSPPPPNDHSASKSTDLGVVFVINSQPTELILGFFCFINFPIYSHPSQHVWNVGLRDNRMRIVPYGLWGG